MHCNHCHCHCMCRYYFDLLVATMCGSNYILHHCLLFTLCLLITSKILNIEKTRLNYWYTTRKTLTSNRQVPPIFLTTFCKNDSTNSEKISRLLVEPSLITKLMKRIDTFWYHGLYHWWVIFVHDYILVLQRSTFDVMMNTSIYCIFRVSANKKPKRDGMECF